MLAGAGNTLASGAGVASDENPHDVRSRSHKGTVASLCVSVSLSTKIAADTKNKTHEMTQALSHLLRRSNYCQSSSFLHPKKGQLAKNPSYDVFSGQPILSLY